jgi:hypothetical protein
MSIEDSCENSDQLNEKFCTANDRLGSTLISCGSHFGFICESGRCVEADLE